MPVAEPYQPSRSPVSKVVRRITQYRNAAPAWVQLERAVLSITFDDCPESAVTVGAELLDSFGVKGGFYIATALLDQTNHMGPMVTPDQIRDLVARGHEIGAHSHTHLDCFKECVECVSDDVDKNLQRLNEICAPQKIESFAYPYGETSFAAKKCLSDRFTNLRGILPGINRGKVDRAQLRAYEADGNPDKFLLMLSALEDLAADPGWMIMFTHDVSTEPSAFGMTPNQLTTLLLRARQLGIEVCPPAEAARKAGVAPE